MERQAAARIAAPAAFLAAVTIGVLVVRAGLDTGEAPPPATTSATTVAAPPETGTTLPATSSASRFYEIQRGDTLASVAARYGTTVEDLLELNPDVDPVALRIGQRIRVE